MASLRLYSLAATSAVYWSTLTTAVLLGGIAVFFVIMFFLRDIRASIVVCATIPTSLIITFLFMYMAGYTLNQISLSSLAIAIGMVVDNAIVILDNIKRYLEKGVSSRESAISGAVEMGTSVMASTSTTIVIFLPIIFTTGITNIMFGQLAMIITMALAASFISALMLTPKDQRSRGVKEVIEDIRPAIESIPGMTVSFDSGDVSADAEVIINSIPVPPGFSWRFAGNEEQRQESFIVLLQAALLGCILVYMVMASQFESLLAPFIIAMSIPFGFSR
ncbi:MAG TPA: hypothetical protein DCG57_04730 [Candidatus Riflebacteria bacterium]|nr:hypothetical protein [Candidatus Riflebacteria bacterium]